jgi:hypothetical protein
MTAAGVFSLLPLFLSFPVSTHEKASKLRLIDLPAVFLIFLAIKILQPFLLGCPH